MVTAAELLSVAAFNEGRHAQAFPSFGSERTGAPVVSFCRIDDHSIRSREPISEPDALIIVDATLLHQVNVFGGLKTNGHVLVNTSKSFSDLRIEELFQHFDRRRFETVAATELARDLLGRPLPNAGLLGGFAALTAIVRLESVKNAITQRFPGEVGVKNVAVAEAAYECVRRPLRASARQIAEVTGA